MSAKRTRDIRTLWRGGLDDGITDRVKALIQDQEQASERLIGWVQLALVLTFATFYFVGPRPTDAPARMLVEPVPIVLAAYAVFTIARLVLAYRVRLPGWLLVLSILVDTALLISLIWVLHGQYGQPPPFSLKVPTFIYLFVFIALRALRFDHRYVLLAGATAALAWVGLLLIVIEASGPDAVTRDFTRYINGNFILRGAEFDKIFTLLIVTGVLAIAIWRARRMLITAVREEAEGRDIKRFLPDGVADAITHSETMIQAGQAEERQAAIVMLDIRGFTRFSTTVPPAGVVDMLTSLHARIVPIIEANGGIIDKFLGDGVMATFGAVAPSLTAAADALRALEAVMDEVVHWQAEHGGSGTSDGLRVNGAAAAGTVVFATLGSAKRLEYTVIGEAVNLAAKLEKHNKIEGTSALVPLGMFELALTQGYDPIQKFERRDMRTIAGAPEPMTLTVVRA